MLERELIHSNTKDKYLVTTDALETPHVDIIRDNCVTVTKEKEQQ